MAMKRVIVSALKAFSATSVNSLSSSSLLARDFHIDCEAWIRKGDPKEVICHEVKRVQPDLLVVGCRGRGPFQSCRVFVGTVSEFCVKHAECPVITIKTQAEQTPQDPVDD